MRTFINFVFAINIIEKMNTFDLIIFLPIVFGLIIGLFKGFVKELVSFLAIIVALIAAEMFASTISPWVADFFNFSEKTGKTVAYILVFIAALIVMFLLSKFTEKIISKINLGWLNSLAGGVLGALKYAVIISILMNVFEAVDLRFHLVKQEKKEASIGYVPILKLAPSLWKESKKIYEQQKQKDTSKETNNATIE
ncbi:Colicin V production protein [uncultured Paludibacter sp.]|nr:Colicin V production protein [uncultured Paludibacter sp.]